jgi:hypothetical protein
MTNLSTQVHELEKRLESIEYENENLKIMLYRMIASNESGIELVPYSDKKGELIKVCQFYMRDNVPHIGVKYADRYNVEPNNTKDEL